MDVITEFSIFNPSLLPENESNRDKYGASELEILLSHYASCPLAVDAGSATSGWRELKEFWQTQT